ncbi:MAG TPA: ATP-dependent DNA ligase [Opitutaceae bacterium]|nr:ATP-dependent DNA ligase [Opitutaceae bacterium]
MSWEVQFRNGVWLPQVQWWLDARFPAEQSFVSHAHFDHVAAHRRVLCSTGTARLLRARLPAAREEVVLGFGQTAPLADGCDITLHPAGHIFGSAQCLLRHERHGRLLYTGDFKLRAGLSAEPCATPPADVLIMETTYGRPHYRFPPSAEVMAAIARFCQETIDNGEVPVLFGYSLGKSQEVLSGLASAGLPVMLHPQTERLTRIYEEFGLVFPPYRTFAAPEARGHVVICPPQAPGSAFLRSIAPRRTAVITGWALDSATVYRYQCDAAFPLSDHADFPDLLTYVERVKPSLVLTLHGFAADFARALRERGVEAWAIAEDNQLELSLPSPVQAPGAPAAPAASRSGTGPSGSPNSPPSPPVSLAPGRPGEPAASFLGSLFSQFAAVADRVQATPRKLEKIDHLKSYFQSLLPEDAGRAALYFTGRAFPQSDGRGLQLGWSVLKRAVLGITGVTEAEIRATYHRLADGGDTLGALLQGRTQPQPMTLAELETFFAELAAVRGPAAKLELMQARFAELSGPEVRYLVKIITGDLRIGLKEGLVEEAVAAAYGRAPDAVREANMLCGDIAAVTRAASADALGKIRLKVFHPLQFMLASPEPTAQALLDRLGAPLWLEEKYDGIRCQVHREGGRVELFSRDLHRITEQFPDLARAAAALPGDFIIDGELLAWRDGRALPFAELQKRLGRKGGDDFFLGAEIPVSISAYDLLWRNGRVLLGEPLAARRALLAELLAEPSPAFVLAPVREARTAVEIEAAFLQARARGNEGLMAKDPRSAYTPGRRGLAWLKLKKAYATLDVVVVGAEYGHGKRRDVLSDVTFAVRDGDTGRLLTVGKAYSGLTDEEIARCTQHFLEHTLEVRGRYRAVAPDLVLEVAFDSIRPSPRHQSGFALRFPRILRIRADKTPAEIDTLDTCRRLAAADGLGSR